MASVGIEDECLKSKIEQLEHPLNELALIVDIPAGNVTLFKHVRLKNESVFIVSTVLGIVKFSTSVPFKYRLCA